MSLADELEDAMPKVLIMACDTLDNITDADRQAISDFIDEIQPINIPNGQIRKDLN